MTAQLTIDTGLATTLSRPRLSPRLRQAARVGAFLSLLHRVAPRSASDLVEKLFFSPRRLGLPIRYEHLLDEADSYTQLQHGAHTIPVYSWGQGPVVLMVHGWSGGGIQFGAYVAPLVAAGYRVVVFDAPAHGRAQGSRTHLYEMAEVVTKVAASVGAIDTIIAHSIGSLAAARAVADGVDARQLVMLAPPKDLASVVAGFGAALGLPAAMIEEHRRRMEARFGDQVWQRFSFDHLAPVLSQKGLVVVDLDDQSIPASQSDQVHLRWPHSEKLQTSGLGHYRLLWHPQVVQPVIRRIVAGA